MRNSRTEIFITLDDDLILRALKAGESRPITVDWKSWEMREELSHYSSWYLTIPYLKIREEFQEAPPGKLCFLMIDPMEALLRMLDRWYRLGGQKRAFPFFETFKEKVDALDRSSTDFARELAEWLIEQNPRPLYNPQIATLDASRRLYMAKKLLKKDFDYKRNVSVEENRSQSDRSPIMKIDRQRDREHFAAFFEEDAALFEAIESGVLDKRRKRADRKTKIPQKAEKRKKGLITRISPRRIEGWTLADAASKEPYFLILRVNGKRLLRRELSEVSEKNIPQSSKGVRRRVKFALKGLKIGPHDRVVLVLQPGAYRFPFSPEAKGFFDKTS